jgi:hypothetical protein
MPQISDWPHACARPLLRVDRHGEHVLDLQASTAEID